MQKRPKILPFALFCSVLAVSTASIFIRFAQEQASSLVISAYRLVLAALILLPFSVRQLRSELPRLGSREIRLGLLSGAFLALHFATWITSLEYTTVASSVVLVTTTPLWVAIFSPLFLKERLDRAVILGLAIALIGGTVVGMSDACGLGSGGIACPSLGIFFQGRAMWGNLLALIGAWCAAGYFMIGRGLRSRVSLQTYTVGVYGTAGLILLGLVLVTGQTLTGFPAITYLWLACLAIIPQVIGHSTYNWSLRYLPVTIVSVSLLGEPVGSTILAYLLLGETPGVLKLVGGALILVGIYLSARRTESHGREIPLRQPNL
jgi:drug/metabolite transporter (DMT)-like permease